MSRWLGIKPLRTDGNGIICLEFRHHKGCAVKLSDGSEIKAGDKIVGLHLSSAWFRRRRRLGLTSPDWHWEVLHCLRQDLSLLANQMSGCVFSDITALHGVTLLHVGAKRLGFQVNNLPNTLWKRLVQFYLTRLMQIHYLGKGKRFKAVDESLELKEVWLSHSALLARYETGRY